MNPNPANNQITDNNNQPINPESTPLQPLNSQPELNPVNNQGPLTPQLESETPMDITIFPSNENPNVSEEPQKINEINNTTEVQPITSISPNPELPPLPPLQPSIPTPLDVPTPSVNQPIPNLVETPTVNSNPVSPQENKLINPNTQKIAIIGGALFGVLLVASASVYYLTTLSKKATTPVTTATPTSTATPTPIPTPVVQKMTLGEYKLRTDSIFLKYSNTIKNNPINLSSNVLSTETVKFVGDEIFALATEVSELNVPTELSTYNTRLNQELNFQVQTYDSLLKSYKTANTLTAEMKNKFTVDLKASTDRLNLLINEIKNLK